MSSLEDFGSQSKFPVTVTDSDENQAAVVHAMLLPLNTDTLLNEKVLADLYAAMRLGMPVVLLHVQEEEYGAVPFGTFFAQCPPHLKVSELEANAQSEPQATL
jgi:hypothetical protein